MLTKIYIQKKTLFRGGYRLILHNIGKYGKEIEKNRIFRIVSIANASVPVIV